MQTVTDRAATGDVVGIHAIDRMAGIGKTALAVHAAHQLAPRFPDGQISLQLHAPVGGELRSTLVSVLVSFISVRQSPGDTGSWS